MADDDLAEGFAQAIEGVGHDYFVIVCILVSHWVNSASLGFLCLSLWVDDDKNTSRNSVADRPVCSVQVWRMVSGSRGVVPRPRVRWSFLSSA